MKVQFPKILKLKGPDGTEVSVDVSKTKMTKGQAGAMAKLAAGGDLQQLSVDEKDVLKDLKAQVQGGDIHTMFIVRFDLSWVRID